MLSGRNPWSSKRYLRQRREVSACSIDTLALVPAVRLPCLSAQDATGNWIKILQRVPVRIPINADELARTLAGGFSHRGVNVNLHAQSSARYWPHNRRHKGFVRTNV